MKLSPRYNFSPPVWATLSTLLVCVLFLQLSRWQFHRFHEKLSLQTRFTTREHSPPLTLTEILKRETAASTPQTEAPTLQLGSSTHLDDLLFYPVTMTGYFDPHYQFLLDNQVQNGRIGYDVLTVFHPDEKNAQQPSILVNRGFIVANNDRRILPELPPVNGRINLLGRLALPPKKIFALGDIVDTPHGWPQRIEALDLTRLQTLLPSPLLANFIVLMDPSVPHGFERQWHGISTDPYRSLGYAWQWLGFAFTLIIIYIALNLKKAKP